MNTSFTVPIQEFDKYIPNSVHRIQYMKKTLLQDSGSVRTWGLFSLFVVIVFHFCSDGDFSFLLVGEEGSV